MSHPQTYKAYAFTRKDGNLEKVTLQWKDPKENQVVIKVLACGVCHSDAGVKGARFGTLPRVPGHEIIGDIVALGPGETHFKIGQRVGGGWHGGHCGTCQPCRTGEFQTCENQAINGVTQDGGYAEYATLRTEALVSIPKDMDPVQAAPLLCAGVTTFNSLRAMDVRPGDIVAVQGIGGLGHLALQFSKAMGYRTVALSSSPAKREMAHHLGATDYIDGSKVDQAQALLDLGGAKVIMVTAPNSEVIQSLMGGLCVGGQLLILALPEEPATVSLVPMITKRLSIIGWPSGHAKDSEDTVNFARLAGVRTMIEEYPLDKAQEAFDHLPKARFRAVLVP